MNPRVARLMHVGRLAGASRVYDSRIEIWAARLEVDAREVRGRLNAGFSVTFVDEQGFLLHRIEPDEVR